MTGAKADRLISLDAFRGFTIVAMVIVNSPGSWSHVYAPLLHAPWHGWTPTDLVFPFFLFIVGVSIALAYSKQLEAGAPLSQLRKKIAIRAIKIFAVGIFLNLWPYFDFAEIRVAGVLQRIAIVFAVCALLFLSVRWKQQLAVGACILIGYWIALAALPVPLDEVGERALAEGVVERSHGALIEVNAAAASDRYLKANYEPGINLSAWVDRRLLPGRFWERTWDPEGLLATLPAVATGIFGMLVGILILSVGDPYRRLAWLFFVGFAALCLGEGWSWQFPMNKNLWSSSFVMATGGLATLFLASCMLMVDTLGWKRGARMGIVFGANPIVAYALAGMLTLFFYSGAFGMPSPSVAAMAAMTSIGVPPKLASLSYAVGYVFVIYGIVAFMYRRRIFVKL